jgi:hypothetical protein
MPDSTQLRTRIIIFKPLGSDVTDKGRTFEKVSKANAATLTETVNLKAHLFKARRLIGTVPIQAYYDYIYGFALISFTTDNTSDYNETISNLQAAGFVEV